MNWLACRLLLFGLVLPCAAQQVRWTNRVLDAPTPALRPAHLSFVEQGLILRLLRQREEDDFPLDRPDLEDPQAHLRGRFFRAPVGVSGVILADTSTDVDFGNSRRWLVRLSSGHRPRIIASPKDRFGDGGLGVQPTRSHGLHDLVIRYHISDVETGFCWYRFDGRRYRLLSSANGYSNDPEGIARMSTARQHCLAANEKCNLIRYKKSA